MDGPVNSAPVVTNATVATRGLQYARYLFFAPAVQQTSATLHNMIGSQQRDKWGALPVTVVIRSCRHLCSAEAPYSFIHWCMHSRHSRVRLPMHSCVHSLVHAFIHSLIHSVIPRMHSRIHSSMHSLCPCIPLFIHYAFLCSFICCGTHSESSHACSCLSKHVPHGQHNG